MSIDDLLSPREDAAPPPVGRHGSEPLLRVRDLQLLTRREEVFGPLDWQLDADELGVVVGQQGSGRSTLLLALGGRMRGITGQILLHDRNQTIEGVARPRELLKRTAIARIRGLADIEKSLTVGDCVDERCAIDGINRHAGRQRFHELKTALDSEISRETVVEQLSAPDRALVTAMLACLSPASYALYDDVDASLTEDQLRWMFDQLQVLTDLGHTFIVSALDTAVMPARASVLVLDSQHARRPEAHRSTPTDPAHDSDPHQASHGGSGADVGGKAEPGGHTRAPQSADGAARVHRPAHLLDSDATAVFGDQQTPLHQLDAPLYREDTK